MTPTTRKSLTKDFRTILKETRIEFHIGQSAFARSLGISQKHLSMIENCHVFPSWPLFFEMCDKLGYTMILKFNHYENNQP